jgi:hypothetical protein
VEKHAIASSASVGLLSTPTPPSLSLRTSNRLTIYLGDCPGLYMILTVKSGQIGRHRLFTPCMSAFAELTA